MKGTVVQISVSKGGVPKRGIKRGEITHGGIAGDAWRHRRIHGIPTRTILLITFEGLEEIQAMGFPVYPGALGENLTTRGLDRRALRIGQQFRCGSAVIQLTELRVPCRTIGVYGKDIDKAIFDVSAMKGDPSSKVWGLSGFYAAVKEPGWLLPGDAITLVPPAL
jgi:MOSC domain-containing protein YiiM